MYILEQLNLLYNNYALINEISLKQLYTYINLCVTSTTTCFNNENSGVHSK
jgi:hypothetical protein